MQGDARCGCIEEPSFSGAGRGHHKCRAHLGCREACVEFVDETSQLEFPAGAHNCGVNRRRLSGLRFEWIDDDQRSRDIRRRLTARKYAHPLREHSHTGAALRVSLHTRRNQSGDFGGAASVIDTSPYGLCQHDTKRIHI